MARNERRFFNARLQICSLLTPKKCDRPTAFVSSTTSTALKLCDELLPSQYIFTETTTTAAGAQPVVHRHHCLPGCVCPQAPGSSA